MSTADAVQRPVTREGIVMNLLEPRELREQVGGKPEEALGFTDRAEGHFEVMNTPGRLGRPSREREPQAETPGRLAELEARGQNSSSKGSATSPERVERARPGNAEKSDSS